VSSRNRCAPYAKHAAVRAKKPTPYCSTCYFFAPTEPSPLTPPTPPTKKATRAPMKIARRAAAARCKTTKRRRRRSSHRRTAVFYDIDLGERAIDDRKRQSLLYKCSIVHVRQKTACTKIAVVTLVSGE